MCVYHTHATDNIDRCISQLKCLCQMQIENYYSVILNYHHRLVTRQICNLVEQYSFSPGVIE